MNAEFLAAIFTGLWTGIVTSVSPCPLATNIAALSYIFKHSSSHKFAIIYNGFFYSIGRAIAYIVIGYMIVKSLLSAPAFSFFMQKYGNQILSPILILGGMYMLEMFGQNFAGFNLLDLSKFKAKGGTISFVIMGFLFAMAFCPISAALYFGVVIPMAAASSAPFLLPLLYGIGTALPVIAIALALEFGFKKISGITGLAGRFEKYSKPATGWVFVAAGIYLALKDIFHLI